MICISGAVPECLEITPIFETVNRLLVAVTPILSVFIAIGLGIGISLFMLYLILNVIDQVFLQPELAKLKRDNQTLDGVIALFDEEEKPKRKRVNGILMREGDWINEALMEPEDGEIVYYDFEDEEELKR